MQQVTRAADVTMATASSAQREPSMEEILASIRRIIEDSDSGHRPGEAAAGPLPQAEPEPEPAPEPSPEASPEVEAFRAELRGDLKPFAPVALAGAPAAFEPEPQSPPLRAPQEERRAFTLAEIGERIAHENEHAPAAAHAPASEPYRPGLEYGEAAPATTARTPAPASPQASVEEVPEAPAQALPVRPTLVSEQTSRQVAAAFGELSEAFASRSRKSFEEMAQEMLRPMLQDWLDNNLPTLVERLVREEIERVARGAGA